MSWKLKGNYVAAAVTLAASSASNIRVRHFTPRYPSA